MSKRLFFFAHGRRALGLLLACLLPLLSQAQLALTGTAPVTVDFDNLGTSATAALPDGFVISNAGTTGITYSASTNTTATTLAAGTITPGALATNSSGGAYNFGNGVTATATDRALGFLSAGSYTSPRHLLLAVFNSTGTTVADLNVAYDVEKYREGQRVFEWQFYTSSDGTNWTPQPSVTISYPASTANTVVNPPTTTSKSITLTGLNLAPGTTTYLRWSYVGTGGSTNGQALALDNLVLTPTLTSAPVAGITTRTVTGPFCVSATAAQSGVSVPFIVSGGLTGTFSAQLSDAVGVFSTNLTQNIVGQGSASPLTATIPAGTPAGTGYRLRVVHAASGTIGRDNGTDLVVGNVPANNTVTISPNGAQSVTTNGTGTPLTASPTAPSTYVWFFGSNATGPFSTAVSGATGSSYTPRGTDFGGPGTYYLVVQATSTCGGVVGTSAPVTINVTAPAPTLTITPRPVPDFGSVYVGNASPEQSLSISGTNLTAPITLTPPPGFELRLGTGAFACCAVTLTPSNGTLAPTTVDVRFVPALVQVYASGITVGSTDRPGEPDVPVSGTGVAPIAPATVASAAATAIAATSATAGGTVVSDGGGPVTERGVVFGLNPYPTVADSLTVDGGGTGTFSSALTRLQPGQTYYLRAYATNTEGTVYGELLTFTTPAPTLAPEPTQSATLTATSVLFNSVTLAISGGDGSSKLLVVSQGASITATPVDAVTYVASTQFGQGTPLAPGTFVVLAAPATGLTVTGLRGGTQYSFAVFDYNDAGTPGRENYLLSNPGQLTLTTPAPVGQLLFTENFAYPSGERLTAHGWTAHSSAGNNPILVASAGLTWPNYPASGGYAAALTATGEDVSRTFPMVGGDQLPVYAALLVQVNTANSADYFFHLGPDPLSTTYRARVFVQAAPTAGFVQFGVGSSVNGSTPVFAPTEYAVGSPVLLVVRYTFGSSGAETSLFINPGTTEPATADATTTEPASAVPANLGTVALRQGNNTSPMVIDGLRVATSYVLARPSGTPLPVELTAFTAQAEDRAAVRLSWTTASEKNSLRFEVERSADGTVFTRVAAVAAAGNSSTPNDYALLDTKLPTEATSLYYRLRQVDQDGSAGYSPVRSVLLAGKTSLTLFPNPTGAGTATLQGAAPGTLVRVMDALGRQIATATADADGTAALVLPRGLAGGIYIVRAGTASLRLTVE